MKKLLIFHRNIAPYRIDFFNDFNKHFSLSVYLFYANLTSQNFNTEKLYSRLTFKPFIMNKGFLFLQRTFRFGFTAILRRNKPDYVMVNEYGLSTLIITFLRSFFRKKYKVISICDDSKDIAQNCTGMRLSARNYLLKRMDGIILCNEEVQKWYFDHYPNIKTTVFPIIQEDCFIRSSLEQAIPIANQHIEKYKLKGKKVVLFVGRLVTVKNLPFLIKSFSKVIANEPQAILVMIGAGDQEGKLKTLVEEMNLSDYILLPGRFEGEQLLAWYSVGTVFVLPSIYEPFGAVTNEALLAGIPALVSEHAGSTCLITKKNGAVFSLSENELTDLMIAHLANSQKTTEITCLKESLMPYTYRERMESLISWLNKF